MALFSHNDLCITQHTVVIPRLPVGFEGLRLVQISDLHFYQFTEDAYYQHLSEQLAALAPDLIVMTGDVIHYGDAYLPRAEAFLSQLSAPEGQYAVLGNHDYMDTAQAEKVSAMLPRAGFHLLKNSHVALTRPGGDRLWLVGLDDLWYGKPDIAQALQGVPSQQEVTLCLAHNPLLFDPLAYFPDACIDLVLAGHTHGGHVYLPPLQWVYRTVFDMKYRYGFYQKNQSQLYVTSGVGSAAFYLYKKSLYEKHIHFAPPRFRFNTWPEIVVLTLTAAQ